jgi:hypothetical protein
MTRIIDTKRWAAVAVMAAAAVALGAGVASARDDHRDGHRDRPHYWGGGYYRAAPPVVYGTPYYAPPPVVYGPGIGLNINIR